MIDRAVRNPYERCLLHLACE